jgi:hypothetical protein
MFCVSFKLFPSIFYSALLSMLPWPKPPVWPSVPSDASPEVLEKEKVRFRTPCPNLNQQKGIGIYFSCLFDCLFSYCRIVLLL